MRGSKIPGGGRWGSDLASHLAVAAALFSAREVWRVGVSFVGTLVLARLLGLDGYGLYAAALGIVQTAAAFSDVGILAPLVRDEEEPSGKKTGTATVLQVGVTTLLVAGVWGVAGAVESFSRIEDLAFMLIALSPALIIESFSLPRRALLARRLQFKEMALAGVLSQALYFTVSIACVCLGAASFGPVVGWWCEKILLCALFSRWGKIAEPFGFDANLLPRFFSTGVLFSIPRWATESKRLILPVVAGPFIGIEGVGAAAAMSRLMEVVSFPVRVSAQLGFASFASLRREAKNPGDKALDVLLVQAPLQWFVAAALVVSSSALVPVIVGEKWIPALVLLPFLGAGMILRMASHTVIQMLNASGHFLWTAILAVGMFAMYVGAVYFGVSRTGLDGFGWAQLTFGLTFLAALALTFPAHCRIPRPVLVMTTIFCLSFSLFWPFAPWVLVLLVVPLLPTTWRSEFARLKKRLSALLAKQWALRFQSKPAAGRS